MKGNYRSPSISTPLDRTLGPPEVVSATLMQVTPTHDLQLWGEMNYIGLSGIVGVIDTVFGPAILDGKVRPGNRIYLEATGDYVNFQIELKRNMTEGASANWDGTASGVFYVRGKPVSFRDSPVQFMSETEWGKGN